MPNPNSEHNPETTKQALKLLGSSEKGSPPYNQAFDWLFEEPRFLVSFLQQQVNRLSQLPQLPTAADASQNMFHPRLTDFEHGVELLLRHTWSNGGNWSRQLCESRTAHFLVDFMNRDETFIYAIYRKGCHGWPKMLEALFDSIILFSNQAPNMRPGCKLRHDNVSKAWRAMWDMINMVDRARREFLANPSWNGIFSEVFQRIIEDDSLERPNYFSGSVLERVVQSGRFLAEDYGTIKKWSSLIQPYHVVPNGPVGELLQFFGVDHIVAQLRRCLPARTTQDYNRMCLIPVSQFNTSGSKEFHELFWKFLAKPMIEQLWHEINVDDELGLSFTYVRAMLLLIRSTFIKPSPSCMAICQLLASTDFFALIGRALVVSTRDEDEHIQADVDFFTSFLTRWITNCESKYSLKLSGVLLTSMEPIYLITLDILTLLQEPWDLDEPKSPKGIPSRAVLWRALGDNLGLGYKAMRTPKSPDEPVGCSWRRCPFFNQPYRTGKPMFACTGCLKVQYCTRDPCQTRDWHEGGHKHSCTNKTPVETP